MDSKRGHIDSYVVGTICQRDQRRRRNSSVFAQTVQGRRILAVSSAISEKFSQLFDSEGNSEYAKQSYVGVWDHQRQDCPKQADSKQDRDSYVLADGNVSGSEPRISE